MSKKKIVIGIILTAVLSVGACVATTHYIQAGKPIDAQILKTAYENTMKEQLDKQKEELTTEYEEKYNKKPDEKEKTVEDMCLRLGNVVSKYYPDNKNIINITKNTSLDNFVISFANEKKTASKDNDNKRDNIYNINNTVSVLNNGKTLRSSLTVSVESKADEKFDISNNKLLIDYFNVILNREITDDEKNALNIGVNMNLSDLSSIKDLKNYIYNNNQIKIENSIISTKTLHPKIKDKNDAEVDDLTRTITELTVITDENNRFYKDVK